MVGAYCRLLLGAEAQDARVGEVCEFIPEGADVIDALLRLGA